MERICSKCGAVVPNIKGWNRCLSSCLPCRDKIEAEEKIRKESLYTEPIGDAEFDLRFGDYRYATVPEIPINFHVKRGQRRFTMDNITTGVANLDMVKIDMAYKGYLMFMSMSFSYPYQMVAAKEGKFLKVKVISGKYIEPKMYNKLKNGEYDVIANITDKGTIKYIPRLKG